MCSIGFGPGFPIGILGQVWYLIVSILDRCTLTYFKQDDLGKVFI